MTGHVVRLRLPHPEFYTCPFCYAGEPTARMQGRGRYKLHGSIVEHLKHFHPSAKVEWSCTECSFIGKGHAPLRLVKEHFAKLHSTRQSAVLVAATTASPVTRTDTAVTATTLPTATATTTTTTRYAATTTSTGTTTTAGPKRRSVFSQQRSYFSTAPGSLSLQRPSPVQKTLSLNAATTTTVNTMVAGTTYSSHGGTSRTPHIFSN